MIKPKLDWKAFDYTKLITDPIKFYIGENAYLILIEDRGYPKGNTTNKPEYYVSLASAYGSYLDNFWDTDNDWDEGQELHVVAYCELGIPVKAEEKLGNDIVNEIKKLLKGHRYINTSDGKHSMREVTTEDMEQKYAHELATNCTVDWALRRIAELEEKEESND